MYPRASYPTGGIFVHEQVLALQRRGVQVAVLSGEPFWIKSYRPSTVSHALQTWHRSTHRWTRWNEVSVMYFPYCVGGIFRNALCSTSYLAGAMRAIEIVRQKFPFNLVHAHTSFLDGYAGATISSRFKCPLVLTEHMGPFSTQTRNLAYRHHTRTAVTSANRVLAVSHALRRDMINELGNCAERVEVLGNGFDPSVFWPAKRLSDQLRPRHALWVGDSHPIKGADRLIEAFAQVVSEDTNFNLMLMCNRSSADVLMELARARGVDHRIYTLPSGNREAVAAAMEAAEFVVVSSKTETFSLVALEALASGRPVLTTACGGPEDFVIDGKSGLVVPNSTDGLIAGLRKMIQTHGSFEMTEFAAEVHRTRTWNDVAESLEEVYSNELLDSRMPTAAASCSNARRILMITTDHLMIDRRILQEARSLKRAGYEVEILAGFECANTEQYTLEGIKVSRFVFDWNDARAQRVLRYFQFRQNRFWPKIWKTTCRLVSAATGLTSFEVFVLNKIRERKFDVLHVHDFPLLNVGVAAKKELNCQLVYDAHELYHAQASLRPAIQRQYRRRERRLIHKADESITVNPYIAGIMARDYRCRPPRVILNAAPRVPDIAAAGKFRSRNSLCSEARIVLYQGWMSPERGIDNLVRAAAQFIDGVHLVLIGYGECEEQLKRISADQGTNNGKVLFLGRIEPDELTAITREADLGVIPYHPVDLNHLYCSPNKLFEFASACVPFLANDLPFLRDIADEHGFGVIADLSQPASIASAVNQVMTDLSRLAALKSAAASARDKLNWELEELKLLDLYAGLHKPDARAPP